MLKRTRSASRLIWLLVLAVMLVAIGLPAPPTAQAVDPTPPAAKPDPTPSSSAYTFLERQARALRPSYRNDLYDLADAPQYTIEATIDLERAVVDGRLVLAYRNRTGRPLTELAFRLLPNAQSIYGGGDLSVEAVRRGEHSAAFELAGDRTVLRLPLRPQLAPGGNISVEIAFRTQVPVGSDQGYGILNRARGVTSLAGWYPILALYEGGWQTPPVPAVGDAMHAETGLYDVTLSMPDDVELVSTGTAVAQQNDGEETTWHIVSGPARDFAVVLSERFELSETVVDGVRINYYALPTAEANTSPATALEMTADAFAAYADRFGPYPFNEFDVVESSVWVGGYEFSGMVSLEHSLRAGGSSSHYRYVLAHEVAHQWWYNLVGNDPVDEPWLDESLASYAPSIYLEDEESVEAGQALIASFRRTYGRRSGGDPVVDSSALSFSDWPTYRAPTYYHGALFLDDLRDEVGDAGFYRLLQAYLRRHRYGMATTADFLALAERIAGQDLDGLFSQWFSRSAWRSAPREATAERCRTRLAVCIR